ncbi:GNAT family N-acetyltransferase [Tsukamurella soli]|uniref:Acetyltransferase n=1 Tax=Tsukamurella soli TaxID=644556 RepID=A0ABP8JHJ8_9ACTN
MGPQRIIHDVNRATLNEACRVVARAFADDPVLRWIRPRGAVRGDTILFRGLYSALHGVPGTAHRLRDDGVAVGAAFWDPPGFTPPVAQQLTALPRLGVTVRTGIGRGIRLITAIEAARPAEPHWYLSTIGAAVHGRGVGTALLRHGLDRIDGPAYLESSNRANIPLYERVGFAVTGEITIDGGPPLWAMWRPA